MAESRFELLDINDWWFAHDYRYHFGRGTWLEIIESTNGFHAWWHLYCDGRAGIHLECTQMPQVRSEMDLADGQQEVCKGVESAHSALPQLPSL